MAFASLKQDLQDIKKELADKTPRLLCEEAVEGFDLYLRENTKPNTRKGFNCLLKEFRKDFAGRNIVEIPPIVLQKFLLRRWGGCKVSALKQNLTLMKWFYTWSIRYCRAKGASGFANPCDLINIKAHVELRRPEFMSVGKMQEFLSTAKDETYWLILAILATGGLRVSELIGDQRAGKSGLRKDDVKGRTLTIRQPKSGRVKEVAVIPSWVETRLRDYAQGLEAAERIFPVSYSAVYNMTTTNSMKTGVRFSPHYLRKWCASYWSRQGEIAMANFVLRHSCTRAFGATVITSLGARYIAPLSPEEALEKQDKLMVLCINNL